MPQGIKGTLVLGYQSSGVGEGEGGGGQVGQKEKKVGREYRELLIK